MFGRIQKKIHALSAKQKVLLFYVVFTSAYFLLRCIALDQLYMVHDERDIVFSAWSLATSGKDLFGHVFPLNFEGISPNDPLLSIWYSALFWIFFPLKSVFFARLPFVFISSFVPYLLYLIVYKITKKTNFSIIVSLIAALSPWLFHLGRIAMDATLAFPTVLLAILLLLHRKRFLAYVLLWFAFFNYQGFRTIIPCIPFIIESYLQITNKERVLKKYVGHFLFISILLLSVLLIDSKTTSGRTDQVLFLNMERFSSEVDLKRRETIFPLFVSKIFDSKLTESIRYGMDTFTQGLSPQTFFFKGDASPINGTGIGGLFFISSLPFFILGIASLRKSSLAYWFLASFTLWGMIPSLASLNGHSFAIRGALMVVGFSTLIALGMTEGWAMVSKFKHLKKVVVIVFIVASLVDVSTFAYEYFGRRPITLSEVFNERERAVTEFISTLNNRSPVVVYDTDVSTKNTFMTYAFLKMKNPTEIQLAMNNTKLTYQYKNVVFKLCEDRIHHPQNAITIVSNHCLKDAEYDGLKGRKLQEIVYQDTPILVAYFIVPPKIDN